MRWTEQQYDEYMSRIERRRKSRNPADDSGLHPDKPEPVEGNALVSSPPRTRKSRKSPLLGVARRRITFRVFSQRPPDWDGLSVKEIQDCLRHAGLLDGDEWHLLSGEVISEKAHSAAEVRTEITIECESPREQSRGGD